MKKDLRFLNKMLIAVTVMALPISAFAQATSSSSPEGVPRVVKCSGMLKDVSGNLLNGTVVGINFGAYAEPRGGVPQWEETQKCRVYTR